MNNNPLKEWLFKIAVDLIENYPNRKIELNKEEISQLNRIILNDEKISKYQWKYDPNSNPYEVPSEQLIVQPRNLLEDYYIINFLKKLNQFSLKNNIATGLSYDEKFISFFNKQYNILYEMLISSHFHYKLLIPVYGLIIDQKIEEIRFDSNHLFRNIEAVENPYLDTFGIRDFKEPSNFWPKFWRKPPKISLEIDFIIPKRIKDDLIYNGFFPPAPYFRAVKREFPIFLEKLNSIFDFFICYSDNKFIHDVITFGDSFYIILPPFSAMENSIIQSTMDRFPFPFRILILNKDQDIIIWKTKWLKFYSSFYDRLYTEKSANENYRALKWVLEVIRIVHRLHNLSLKAFILVAAFEGILYSEAHKKKLETYNNIAKEAKEGKKGPCAKVFIELSEYYNKYWQFMFTRSYPLDIILESFETKKDLFDFIICAFNIRNNIAHPEKIQNPGIMPISITPHDDYASNEDLITNQIIACFPIFLRFIVKIWLKEGIRSIGEWHEFINNNII